MRWRAERWMKVRHMPAASRARSVVRDDALAPDAAAHVPRHDAEDVARPRILARGVPSVQGHPATRARVLSAGDARGRPAPTPPRRPSFHPRRWLTDACERPFRSARRELRPNRHRLRGVSVRRRPLAARVGKDGRAAGGDRRRAGYTFVVWAPNARRVSRRRRLQRVGRTRAPDAQPRRERPLGDVRARVSATARSTSSRSSRTHGPPFIKADPFALRAELPPQHGVDHAAPRRARVARRRVDGRARRERGTRSIGRWRSTRCMPGSWRRNPDEGNRSLDLARARRRARAVRRTAWASRTSS